MAWHLTGNKPPQPKPMIMKVSVTLLEQCVNSPRSGVHRHVSDLGHRLVRYWLVNDSVPHQWLSHCWLIGNWNLRNKLQWYLIQNIKKNLLRKCIWNCHLQNVGHFVQASKCPHKTFATTLTTLICSSAANCSIINMSWLEILKLTIKPSYPWVSARKT